MGKIILGVIADDFTGAGDAASFIAAGGLRTMLLNGVPKAAHIEGAEAVVVALKSRTQEKTAAVADSMAALRFLKGAGASHIYIKYCSTFDSTAEGNIGPIVDAAMEDLKVSYTLLCPSLPVNGRTVAGGLLYVKGVPLAESPMKDHPLTPMRESEVTLLMSAQSKYPCLRLPDEAIADAGARAAFLAQLAPMTTLVPDYVTDEDGERIARAFHELPLLTGGSGLLKPLAKILAGARTAARAARVVKKPRGAALLLAGSCSTATLAQIAHFKRAGGVLLKLDPAKLLSGEQTRAEALEFIRAHAGEEVLIYSSETAGYLAEIRGETLARYAKILEETLSSLAHDALALGRTRIIVAGGETSGAVTQALGLRSYWIGESVAPGVPVMTPEEAGEVRLVLKSGNFGEEDFFERAVEMTKR